MLDSDFYWTLKTANEAQIREKGSKFFAFAMPANSEEMVRKHLEQLRKVYFDATHHCYAYVLGQDGLKQRANDDGEPNHSAGTPILNQIKAKQLSDTLVVVVRYYGGTKLGVSGLIQAYKQASAEALANAVLEKVVIQTEVNVSAGFEHINLALNLAKKMQAKVHKQHYTENGMKVCFLLPRSETETFYVQLSDIHVLKVALGCSETPCGEER